MVTRHEVHAPPRLAQVTTERARLARLQADAVEIKNARQRGALLDAEAVEREWTAVLAAVRAGMLAVPSPVRGAAAASDAA